MDEAQLKKEGVYQTFESLTQHTETPGCSLCMGNQIGLLIIAQRP
jgi:aconitate hydratase 2/2-methylisocitrate dehydratase